MVVIGIDPGTAITGYGLIEEQNNQKIQLIDSGAIRTDAFLPQEKRLHKLYKSIRQILKTYRPTSGAVEMLFFQKNVRSALSVGQARGIVLLALAQENINVYEYNPLDVKVAVTGYGGAEKGQVQRMVQTILELPQIPEPDDVADAIAVALCHLQNWKFEMLKKENE